mgnify:CR=1 FL=1
MESNERLEIGTTTELATWYDDKYTEMGDGWATPDEYVISHLRRIGITPKSVGRLLDVGCGTGHFIAAINKYAPGVECIGIDISTKALSLGVQHRRFYYHQVLQASIEDVPLAVNSFDYIIAMGSLEHVVDINAALDNIHRLLHPANGIFYLMVPNENWVHMDQPNERRWSSKKWKKKLESHLLFISQTIPYGSDQTIFLCPSQISSPVNTKPALELAVDSLNALNAGSGQRKFDTIPGIRWFNMDKNDKWTPDIVGNWNDLSMFPDLSLDYVVAHHTLEHVGCGEGLQFIKEAFRVLKTGGSLIVCVPNITALNDALKVREISVQIYMTNVFGAYMDSEDDRHKWGYTPESLYNEIKVASGAPWVTVKAFNWRTIPGADIAKDWWVLAIEAVK